MKEYPLENPMSLKKLAKKTMSNETLIYQTRHQLGRLAKREEMLIRALSKQRHDANTIDIKARAHRLERILEIRAFLAKPA